MIPRNFISLSSLGFKYRNYYYGQGGEKIGITKKDLALIGLRDNNLWIHPDVCEPLIKGAAKMLDGGYGIVINDAWRSVELYKLIARRRTESGLDIKNLINMENKPHSTGQSVDIIPTNLKTGKDMWTRNQKRDGASSFFVDFYRDSTISENIEYQKIQDVMTDSFLSSGFVLGTRKEYWHFQLPEAATSEHF
jgi:D-alanyl-D-alanine dipeptidase